MFNNSSSLVTVDCFLNIFGLKQKCFFYYLSNPNKISCQKTDLIRQKSFSFLKKCFRSKQKFSVFQMQFASQVKRVKNDVVMQKHLSIGFFCPSKMGSLRMYYVIRLLIVWVYWQSALLAQQAQMTLPSKEAKELWVTHHCTRP